MIGNNIVVEAVIQKITISEAQNALYSATLKIGLIESAHTHSRKPINNNIYLTEILKVSCHKSNLSKSLNNCQIVIYRHANNQNKIKVGSVPINLENIKPNYLKSYKIEGCKDPQAKVQLSIKTFNHQIRSIETLNSPTSQTSLSQLKQFHKFLNGDKGVSNERSQQNKIDRSSQQNKSDRFDCIIKSIQNLPQYNRKTFSEQEIFTEKKKQICQLLSPQELRFDDQIPKCFQLNQFTLQQPFYNKKNIKTQPNKNQLEKNLKTISILQQANQKLRQLLTIESQKNKGLQKAINQLKLSHFIEKPISPSNYLKKIQRKPQKLQRRSSNPRSKKNSFKSKSQECSFQGQKIKQIMNGILDDNNNNLKENQLIQHNQYLYKQLKQAQLQNNFLKEQLKNKQINEAIYQEQKQSLQQQIKIVNKKLSTIIGPFQLNNKLNQLISQNQLLKSKNKQLQRKLTQSIKAIGQFRIQAMKARNQLIVRNSTIEKKDLDDQNTSQQSRYNLIKLKQVLSLTLKERETIKINLQKKVQQNQQKKFVQIYQNIKTKINVSYSPLLQKQVKKVDLLKHKIQITKIISNELSISKQHY